MIDDTLSRQIIIFAAISGALGVLMGALGAHYLEPFLARESFGHSPEMIAKRMRQFDVGVRYHLIHSVALMSLASLPIGSPGGRRWVAKLFVLGMFLFCGSLYVLVLTETPILGAITPIGGLCWVFAWLLLLLTARRCSSI